MHLTERRRCDGNPIESLEQRVDALPCAELGARDAIHFLKREGRNGIEELAELAEVRLADEVGARELARRSANDGARSPGSRRFCTANYRLCGL